MSGLGRMLFAISDLSEALPTREIEQLRRRWVDRGLRRAIDSAVALGLATDELRHLPPLTDDLSLDVATRVLQVSIDSWKPKQPPEQFHNFHDDPISSLVSCSMDLQDMVNPGPLPEGARLSLLAHTAIGVSAALAELDRGLGVDVYGQIRHELERFREWKAELENRIVELTQN